MRIVQINVVPNLSTGSVMLENHKRYVAAGHESWRMWGRGRKAENEYEFNFGSRLGTCIDIAKTRLCGKAGFYSKAATKRLLTMLDEIQPDLVHLHNIHGYYLNVEMLFDWLCWHDCKVEWTLHDCWPITGHCCYFIDADCDRWKQRRGGCESCMQTKAYPKTYSSGSCSWSYSMKRRCFTKIKDDRMTLITPSNWLAEIVRESYLSKYAIKVIPNTVDTAVMRPTSGTFRDDYKLQDSFLVLGVASTWSERKGLDSFCRLAEELDGEIVVVLVGLSEKQLSDIPKNIVGLRRTNSLSELAAIYSTVDLHVQPSREETYGMTVLEALCCGTPVLVRKGSACEEAAKVGDPDGSNTFCCGPSFEDLKNAVMETKAVFGGRMAGKGRSALSEGTEK